MFGSLPNTKPISAGSIDGPNAPDGQWEGWRELSDAEIDELAIAIVKQVKRRGPFLSLSEFVNRRLDSTDENLSLKGALQAALDDDSVTINENFRSPLRTLDNETKGIDFAFNAAAKGPIAYGSSAYVDQADILRNLAEQLTARGDTFIIRAYGDALDHDGKVIARAWCQATVQRVPEYMDAIDESHVKQHNLTSASNKSFGRKMRITAFRWLNPREI